MARILDLRLGLRGPVLALFVVLVISGIGALHEIAEAASTVALGKDYGMLITGPDNPFDTQEDLFSSVIGTCVGLAGIWLRARRR